MGWAWWALLSPLACARPTTHPVQTSDSVAERPLASEPAPPPVRATPKAPAAVLPPDPSCMAYRRAVTACSETGGTSGALSDALALDDPLERDRVLSELEPCDSFEPGSLRVLRAEVAPPECADVIIGENIDARVSPELTEALTALVHASHLRRLVVEAPALTPPFSKQEFAEYSKSVLNDWIVTQAQAIYKIARDGARLSGQARAIVAVEAGLADMRFVEVVRDVPLPEELAHDDELKDVYYAELDVALAPWKDRGRDAALVGLREFGRLGVLRDRRVEQARKLLSQLYGGRRIDRLDGLMMPGLPPATSETVAARLAGQLPTYLLPHLLADLDPQAPGVLRNLIERGLPMALRVDLESRALGPTEGLLLAQGLIRLGQRYWTADDFAAADRVLERTSKDTPSPDAQLLRAVAVALRHGPRDAVEMMLRGPQSFPADVGRLDEVVKARGPWAGAAAFDAAYLLELAPPAGDPAFWRNVSQRYSSAAVALPDPADKARAKEFARAAAQTGDALVPQRRAQ